MLGAKIRKKRLIKQKKRQKVYVLGSENVILMLKGMKKPVNCSLESENSLWFCPLKTRIICLLTTINSRT